MSEQSVHAGHSRVVTDGDIVVEHLGQSKTRNEAKRITCIIKMLYVFFHFLLQVCHHS